MAFDAELERHKAGWQGFTTFIKWGTGTVILVLVLMAIFLL